MSKLKTVDLKEVFAKNIVDQGNGVNELYGLTRLMSEGKIMEQVQKLTEDILPRIEYKHGAEHPDYILFLDVVNTLLHCIELRSMQDKLLASVQNLRLQKDFYFQQAAYLEDKLNEFITVEKLMQQNALEDCVETIRGGIYFRAKDTLERYRSRQKPVNIAGKKD